MITTKRNTGRQRRTSRPTLRARRSRKSKPAKQYNKNELKSTIRWKSFFAAVTGTAALLLTIIIAAHIMYDLQLGITVFFTIILIPALVILAGTTLYERQLLVTKLVPDNKSEQASTTINQRRSGI